MKKDQEEIDFNQALFFHKNGDLNNAETLYKKVLISNPDHINSNLILGTIYIRLKRFNEAKFFLKKTIDLDKNQYLAFQNLGIVYYKENKIDDAILNFNNALSIKKNSFNIYADRALAYIKLEKYTDAINDLNDSLALNSNFYEAYLIRADLFRKTKDNHNALKDYKAYLKIHPNSFKPHYQIASILIEEEEFNEASEHLKISLELNDKFCDSFYLMGNINLALGKIQEAEFFYDKAIELNSNFTLAMYNKGLLNLINGNYNLGWEHYEKRKMTKEYQVPAPIKKVPDYEGQKSGNLFIWAEQGIGDQIFYLRMLHSLPKKLNLTVALDKRLISLYKRTFPKTNFIEFPKKQVLNNYDYQTLSASLGKFYANSENKIKIFCEKKLLTNAQKDNIYIKKYKNKNKLLCGISWLSKNTISSKRKTLQLEQFKILNENRIDFIDLQYGIEDDYISKFNKKYGTNIFSDNEVDKFNDIDNLTSLIQACDFIISISNVTAHLSASIGKKTFILVPFGYGLNNPWYWQDKNKSVWYESVEIFRQSKLHEWDSVLEKLNKRIKQIYKL